ncbi:MAG: hypothetical protein LUQ32_05015 [Methanomicrobiales archaeon]|nr:hypothetical protein [Methanomicrobiales archaeon]
MTEIKPYLSIVTVSRNDDHGGNPLERTQLFIDSLYYQCNRYKLETELIIVEWNPPEDRKRLHEVLSWPKDSQYVKTRIITVPQEVHSTIKNADRIPLFQMIGKNVGIRRAEGQFILATNIDILFSDELIEYLARKKLKENIIYRVDRMDVSAPFSESKWFSYFFRHPEYVMQDYCQSHTIRINKKYGTISRTSSKNAQLKIYLKHKFLKFSNRVTKNIPFYGNIHSNGCGDFTLMSRALWMELRGYPEIQIFSWNIDSLLLIIAFHRHIAEMDLKPPMNVYHIEHDSGSGWTPGKGEELLFKRLEKKKIPVFTWEDCISFSKTLDKMGPSYEQVYLNGPDWGFTNFNLDEILIND